MERSTDDIFVQLAPAIAVLQMPAICVSGVETAMVEFGSTVNAWQQLDRLEIHDPVQCLMMVVGFRVGPRIQPWQCILTELLVSICPEVMSTVLSLMDFISGVNLNLNKFIPDMLSCNELGLATLISVL